MLYGHVCRVELLCSSLLATWPRVEVGWRLFNYFDAIQQRFLLCIYITSVLFGRVDELKPMANKKFCYFFCTGFISVSAYFPLAEKLFLWWQPLVRERESRDRFSSRSRRHSLIVISLSFVRASGLLPFAMMLGDCVEYWIELCVDGGEMRAELLRFLLRVYLWRISCWRLVECGGCCFVLYR